MISVGKPYISIEEIKSRVTDLDIINHYFGVIEVPCVINSPFRADKNPSLSFYSRDGKNVLWTDFATKEHGDIIDILKIYWGESYKGVLERLWEDLPNISNTNLNSKISNYSRIKLCTPVTLECKTREWKQHDIEYWNSFGISLDWLKYADVYPISHKIIIKEGKRMVFVADKYAYAYVEFKDGKTTLKIYQPFNTSGFKWSNNHDKSVISLWTKVPKNGDRICICSSLKDALCLWANTGIPSLAVQGEGYTMSNTAINELNKRYKKVYILFDNDEAGLYDGKKLAESTGFTNIVLPKINNAKDISDLYKTLNNTNEFKNIILKLFI
jgi:hypothetical protein